MMKLRALSAIGLAALALAGATAAAAGSEPAPFRVGAAKVDITPTKAELGPGDSIRDPLFVRAIVVGNGAECAVLVGVDQVFLAGSVMKIALPRVMEASRCPAANVLVSATHVHSGSTGGGLSGKPTSERVAEAIVEATKLAAGRTRPARMVYATTDIDLNVNRDLFDYKQRWVMGPNRSGPSDKTLAVLGFVDDKGLPIAVYMNYAMHPISFFLTGVVSADFPGVATRYIEGRYDGAAVAVFTQGAEGDQRPAWMTPQDNLQRARTHQALISPEIGAPPPWESQMSARNAVLDSMKSFRMPMSASELQSFQATLPAASAGVDAMGWILGEAAIETLQSGRFTRSQDRFIGGASTTVTCPGRIRNDAANPVRQNADPGYSDGPPINLEVGAIRIGDVFLFRVNGELYSEIGSRIKREAPATKSIVVGLANGFAGSGYIYSNNASDHKTFEVIDSRLKPGCAEDGIVEATNRMAAELEKRAVSP